MNDCVFSLDPALRVDAEEQRNTNLSNMPRFYARFENGS